MAREIWLKASVYSLFFENGEIAPLARCGHYETGPNLVWARPALADDLPELECWAKGIVNSSNTALLELKNGYAPVGRADGTTKVAYGVQIREIRNEMSRDGVILSVPDRACAEKLCYLNTRFPGIRDALADILKANKIKPEYFDARQLGHICALVRKIGRESLCKDVKVPAEIGKRLSE